MILYQEAIDRFSETYTRAQTLSVHEPTAVILATASLDARPSARTVLLKDFSAAGFVFFTNQHSRKGEQLAENPWGSLCFFWQELMEQVHVEGAIHVVEPKVSDEYWFTRPCASQAGAWASQQSQPLASRAVLEERFTAFQNQFKGTVVPRPPHWSGYRLVPNRIEFWKSAPYRLHERTCYIQQGSDWTKTLLHP